MYLISVYFDEQANKNLQRYINMIADKTGNTFMTDNNVPPHITLGKKLDKEQMMIAFDVMRNNFAPFDANVTGIGLAKVNPHEDVIRYELM